MRIHIYYVGESSPHWYCAADFTVCPRIGERVRNCNDIFEVVQVTHEINRGSPSDITLWLKHVKSV